jgi:hypothetical protein
MEEPENKIPEKKIKQKTSKLPKKKKPSVTEEAKTAPAPTPGPAHIEIKALTPEESALFLKQINAYLSSKKVSKNKNEPVEYKILQNTTSEFLESYITIGYSYDGQRILMQHYPTPKDRDAILEFLKNVFVTLASKDNLIIDREDDDFPYE